LTLDQIHFRVLWPDANRVPLKPPDGGTSINNVSIVLLGEFDQHRFLLAGDVEEGVDPELLARGLPTVDFLKVAHHGSRTATTEAFLEAVRPRVAAVSAGAGNPYGHPAPSTIERLHAIARETYRTDTDGSVEVAFDGAAIRVRTSGARQVLGGSTPRPRPTTNAKVAVQGLAAAFLCAVPPASPGVVRPPTAPEAPDTPRVALGARTLAATSPVTRPLPGRLRDPGNGQARTLGYHQIDGNLAGIGDRAGARNRSPRLLLGRRRVRPGCGPRGLPSGHESLPRRPAGPLAARDGSRRTRPPPR
jgi:competence protein ComEC